MDPCPPAGRLIDLDKGCLVFPVSALEALSWAKGLAHDRDLVWKAPLLPEAVFIARMPGIEFYKEMLCRVAYWRARGAVCLIGRTANDTVDDHLLKRMNAIPTYQESALSWRFFQPPAAFQSWVDKFTRKPAPGRVLVQNAA